MTPGPVPATTFEGAVLCGGRSRRMGRDKALVEIDGRPMAARVADALTTAGAVEVRAVGGDASALAALGLATIADRWPGEGPLGGIVTALAVAATDVVLVVACDLVVPSPATMAATVAALDGAPGAAVATPAARGTSPRRWDQAAWRRGALPAVARRFDAGERAIHRAVAAAGLVVVDVAGIDEATLADVDAPSDLPSPGP